MGMTMTTTRRWVSAMALGAALAAGACDRKEAPKPATPTPPAPDVTPKADGAGAAGGGAATSDAGQTGKAPVTSTTGPAADAVAATAPSTQPAAAADKVNRAQELIDKAVTAMKDKRTADARQYLDNAEALGDESLREVIKTTRASLETLEKAPADVKPPAQPTPTTDDENK